MSKYLLLCLFNLSFLFNYAQSSDFPKYIDTGNPEKDDAVYAQQKKDWYMSHSDQFKTENPNSSSLSQLNNSDTRKTIKPQVFEPIVDEQRNKEVGQTKELLLNVINNNQELLITDNSKVYSSNEPLNQTTLFPCAATPIKKMPEVLLPESFPKMKNTGNSKKDEADFASEKKRWINDNLGSSEQYLNMLANQPLYPNIDTIRIEVYSTLPAETQEYIKYTLHAYVADSGMQNESESDKNRLLPSSNSIIKVTLEDIKNSPPSKIDYMKAHPEMYDMSAIKQ